MTELKTFLAMLTRAGIGHGLRCDYNPAGTSVQVESGDAADDREWTVTEFGFDADGSLTEVISYPGQEG